MRPSILTASVLAILMAASMAWADGTGPTTKPHDLPADPQTPVITLDRVGGGPDRKNLDPTFQVLSDGTAITGNPFGNEREVKGKLTPDQLQDLLHYILDDMRFDDITSDDLASKNKSSKNLRVSISINADGVEHQLAAPFYIVSRKPPAGSPKDRFHNVHLRLSAARALVVVGGDDAVKKLLVAANAQLKIRLPDEPPLEASDLAYALALPDGSNEVVFSRFKQDQGPWFETSADVKDDGKGHLKVSVDKLPSLH